MIKKANQLVPGDIVLWDGKPTIIESVASATNGKYVIKFDDRVVDKLFEKDATFLVSEKYRIALLNDQVEWQKTDGRQ